MTVLETLRAAPRRLQAWLRPKPRFAPQQQQALQHMQSIIDRRPIAVQFELCTLCNSRCVFCAYRKLKRPRAVLPMDLFTKVCHELNELGGAYVGLSGLVSDALLDPHLIERLRLVRGEFARLTPHLYTNAIALPRYSDDDVRYMLENFEHIDVSIGGLSAADYRQMFDVDQFERVWKSLLRLGALRRELGAACRLKLHIRTNRAEQIRDDPKLGELHAAGWQCEDILDHFANWGGLVTSDDLPAGATLDEQDNQQARTPCLFPMTYLSVLPDGTVNACGCMDAEGSLVMGNLHESSVQEIWQGEVFERFRASFRPGAVHGVCATCAYYLPYDRVLSNPAYQGFSPEENLWSR